MIVERNQKLMGSVLVRMLVFFRTLVVVLDNLSSFSPFSLYTLCTIWVAT